MEPFDEKFRIGNSNAAYSNHSGTSGKSLINVVIAFYSSAEIDFKPCSIRNTLEHIVVDNMFRLCAIEIDDMQTVESQSLKLPRLSHRVIVVHRFLSVVAFGESHTLATDKIYSWNNVNHSSKKFLRMCSPTLPLFSGWNCVAQKLFMCNAAE